MLKILRIRAARRFASDGSIGFTLPDFPSPRSSPSRRVSREGRFQLGGITPCRANSSSSYIRVKVGPKGGKESLSLHGEEGNRCLLQSFPRDRGMICRIQTTNHFQIGAVSPKMARLTMRTHHPGWISAGGAPGGRRRALRIGIECTVLTRSIAGIGYYTHHLLQALARQPGEEEYVLFYNRPLQPMDLPARLRHVWCGPASTHVWVQTRLASLARREGIDLLHSPGQGLPFLMEKPRILTLHDLSPLLFPRQKDWASHFVWTSLVPIMARRADHIITVSDHTRQDVMRLLGIPEERVTRIYEAAAPAFYPEPDAGRIQKFRRDKALEPGYILAVGTLEPRKNYPFLLRVFAQWLERSRPDATLVVIGKKGWLYDDIFETFEALNLRRRVRFEGYVGDPGLMRLYYSAAEFSILPPLYEGFWLPGLESLACGTPVIAPRHSSIPEVIGEAGLLVDSWDEEDWAAAMDRLWMAPDRDTWAQKGLERARQFSWDRAAEETLAVYRAVIQAREGA